MAVALKLNGAGGGLEQSENDTKQCGLAATIRTDNTYKIPVSNVEIDIAQLQSAVISGVYVS